MLKWCRKYEYIDGLVQDWSIAIGNALEILQSCGRWVGTGEVAEGDVGV